MASSKHLIGPTLVTVWLGSNIFYRLAVFPYQRIECHKKSGLECRADFSSKQLEWYGLGPDERSSDRHAAQKVGRWSSTFDDQYQPFSVPQEHDAHHATWAVSFTDKKRCGLNMEFVQGLSFSAKHCFDEDLSAAKTTVEVEMRPNIKVHIDAAMRGLGTAACGPDVIPEYQVHSGRNCFSWMTKS